MKCNTYNMYNFLYYWTIYTFLMLGKINMQKYFVELFKNE